VIFVNVSGLSDASMVIADAQIPISRLIRTNKLERACEPRSVVLALTTGLRHTFVPPLCGRDSAAQPERYDTHHLTPQNAIKRRIN